MSFRAYLAPVSLVLASVLLGVRVQNDPEKQRQDHHEDEEQERHEERKGHLRDHAIPYHTMCHARDPQEATS